MAFPYFDAAEVGRELAQGGPASSFPAPTAHASAEEMFEHAGIAQALTNAGPVPHLDLLTGLVAPAVDAAKDALRLTFDAASEDAEQRVERWARRVDSWDDDAGRLVQHKQLRAQRSTIQQERELLEQNLPAHSLVRPLLVVVPQHFGQDAASRSPANQDNGGEG